MNQAKATAHENSRRPARKPANEPRRWPWVLLVLVILAIGFGGNKALHKFKPKPQAKPLVRQSPTVNSVHPEIRTGGITVSGNGLIQPKTQVTLAAEVSSRAIAVSPNLVAGGVFKKGEILIELNAAPFKASLAQTRAERNSARVAYSLAQQSVERTRNLIEQGFLSRQTLDETIAARDQAGAALQRAKAAYQSQSINLSHTRIAAPFDGRVLSSAVNTGDTVQPGRQLASIFDNSTLEVTVPLTSDNMALVDNAWQQNQPGTPASVLVEHGGTTYQWPARLNRVEAAMDTRTRTFNVVVEIAEPNVAGNPISANSPPGPPLLVGMYAQVELSGRDQGKHALVPQKALRSNNQLWLVDAQNKVQIISVRVIAELDDKIAVASDQLTAKSNVITSDLRIVTPGMSVRIIKPAPSASSAGTGKPELQAS